MTEPLSNKRIVVTRARQQSHALSTQLLSLGAEVIEIPAIRIQELDPAPIREAIKRLDAYALIVLTSASAVHLFTAQLNDFSEQAERMHSIPIAVIGAATVRALEERGYRASIVPEKFHAEGLSEAIDGSSLELSGRRVLIPRAKVARKILNRFLDRRGAVVDDIPIYETVAEDFAGDEQLMRRLEPSPDLLTFTSSSTVTCFTAGLPGQILVRLRRDAIAACIGPVAAITARSEGFRVEVVPSRHTIDGLVKEIVRYYQAEPDSGQD